MFIVGAALAAFGTLSTFNTALESLTVDGFSVPGSQVRDLDPGEYEVFGSAGPIGTFDAEASFDLADITVTNIATGEQLPVNTDGLGLELTRETTVFVVVGVFMVEEAGTFEIDVASNEESLAVVARSFLTSFDRVRVPLVLLGVGALLTIIGVVMLVVGVIRRSRADKAGSTSPSQTPGFYQGNSAAPQDPTAAPSYPPPQAPAPPAPDANPPSESNTPWDS